MNREKEENIDENGGGEGGWALGNRFLFFNGRERRGSNAKPQYLQRTFLYDNS